MSRISQVLLLAWLATSAQSAEPIRTRAQLDAYLRDMPADSPLNAFSPGGRERFLYGLRFGENGGLAGAEGSDLSDELTQQQIAAVLSLFGPEVIAYAPESRRDEVRSFEKNVRSRDAIGAVERRYNDYYRAVRDIDDIDSEVRVRRMAAAFDSTVAELFKGKNLSRVDDRELRLLRRAAQEVALATRAAPYVDAYRALFAERQRRNLVSTNDIETLQSLLLSQHRFAEARRLPGEYPGIRMPRLPAFRDDLGKASGKPTVWRADVEGKELRREALDLAPTQILVTASCHFSKDAAADIAKDALLGPVFAQHAHWLALAPGASSIDDVLTWNRALPSVPILMIYDRDEWDVLPAWRMPEFYVVRDGRVLGAVHGWQRGTSTSRDQLIALLRQHGLLPN
jgi:hypothetical protein